MSQHLPINQPNRGAIHPPPVPLQACCHSRGKTTGNESWHAGWPGFIWASQCLYPSASSSSGFLRSPLSGSVRAPAATYLCVCVLCVCVCVCVCVCACMQTDTKDTKRRRIMNHTHAHMRMRIDRAGQTRTEGHSGGTHVIAKALRVASDKFGGAACRTQPL